MKTKTHQKAGFDQSSARPALTHSSRQLRDAQRLDVRQHARGPIASTTRSPLSRVASVGSPQMPVFE